MVGRCCVVSPPAGAHFVPTCVFSLRLTFCQVTLDLQFAWMFTDVMTGKNLSVWAEFSFHTPVLMLTRYWCLLISFNDLFIDFPIRSLLFRSKGVGSTCVSETGAKVAAPIMALAFSSELHFPFT